MTPSFYAVRAVVASVSARGTAAAGLVVKPCRNQQFRGLKQRHKSLQLHVLALCNVVQGLVHKAVEIFHLPAVDTSRALYDQGSCKPSIQSVGSKEPSPERIGRTVEPLTFCKVECGAPSERERHILQGVLQWNKACL